MVMKVSRKILSILIFLLAACEERIQAPLSSVDSALLVVEGILTSENTNHRIRLRRPYKNQNEKPAIGFFAVSTVVSDTTVIVE
jgi:hypothetical protein